MSSNTQINLSMINMQTNREHAIASDMTFINLSPTFQREYEAWNEKMKTRFIESILLGRAMNPIWTVENSEDGSHEVLDGKHRLTTAIKFLNNEFALGDSLATLDTRIYKGKLFSELPQGDKNKIRNYNFTFNNLDSSYKEDNDKLMDMYEVLNASSKPLNKHEFHKPIYGAFYDLICSNKERWFNTPIFTKDKDTRGNLSTQLTKILALSEERLPHSFTSFSDIVTKWELENLGASKSYVQTCIQEKGVIYKERLDKIKKYMDKFIEEELFPKDTSQDPVATLIIVTRSVALIKNYSIFSRHIENLKMAFNTEIYEGSIQEKLGCASRNAMFQKKMIHKIDSIIMKEINECQEPRLFSPDVIAAKLAEQNRICTLCKLPILTHQKFEGDHILAWSQMGRTIPENCQVVHRKCHKQKC